MKKKLCKKLVGLAGMSMIIFLVFTACSWETPESPKVDVQQIVNDDKDIDSMKENQNGQEQQNQGRQEKEKSDQVNSDYFAEADLQGSVAEFSDSGFELSVAEIIKEDGGGVMVQAAPGAENEEDAKWQVNLIGYDDLEKDSPFTENVCRIIEGTYAKADNEVVINQFLAETNQIKIGDTVSFILGNENVSVKITGFYLTGSERKQTDAVATINRMENQIYTNISFMEKMGISSYEKIIAYVDDPELLSETADNIGNVLGDKAGISTQDTMYQKMKFSIMQVERVTKLIFILTVITSIFVVGMLLCMWMRNRKVEMAVFISLGITKVEVFLQMVLEIICVYLLSSMIAAGIFGMLTPLLSGVMSKIDGFGSGISFSIWNVWKVWLIGMATLAIITLIAMMPCLTKRIKDTLSEMEG